jgi:NADP-dependent aldehyde dehydrogenase
MGDVSKTSDIKTVGSGSFKGRKALFDVANTRPEPIPVFAEMEAPNPVFTPDSRKISNDNTGLAGSITKWQPVLYCTRAYFY